VREKWFSYPEGYKDTSGDGSYLPAQVNSIGNSMLRLRMRNEGGVIKVGAPIPLIPDNLSVKGSLLYGRYAVRFKIDPVPGFKVAWLLWPDSGDSVQDGEIDLPEGDLDSKISGFMHHRNQTGGGDQDAYDTNTTFGSGWHTTVLEWTPNACRFILDGQVIGTSTSRIPSTPMSWVLQSETQLGSERPAPGAVANVYIDWVAAWSWTGP
jgi:beta-glucanase (GH16 family)